MNDVIEYAKEHLHFNFETGEVTWKKYPKNFNKVNKPIVAGTAHHSGYRTIVLQNKYYQLHRIIWAVYYGKMPTNCIDHIDLNKSNNRIANLREATNFQNGYNRDVYKNSTSGFKNVQWDAVSNKWRVRVRVNGKRHHVGRFESKDDAINAAKAFMLEHHKEFSRVTNG